MKLKQITRTSTFTFSPLHASPLLATGTVSGALDDTFSDESKLEFWKPDFLSSTAPFSLGEEDGEGPIVTVTEKSRFNRLGWGKEGIIAGGLENGELHGGPVRGLDWNGIQTNLVASGGINGEVFIWDLKDPTKPYTPTPGSRSTKLDDITSIGWNKVVPYVLGGSSNTGNTVVWDLRGKREVVSLAYGSTPSGGGGGFSGGRRGTSDLAWSPDNATKVVTASESDENPVVAVWDLRNARAPEKILTGHTKGLLSLSWNTFDSSLLLTAGKDNRVLLFNPHTSTVLAELQPSNNWAFSAQFHPLNPSILGAAYFDGRIEVHSIQSTNPESVFG
ncbi:SEC31B protein [Flagelloscypha sp. PMI_526]|nr:SEC31B protein [Flagelloscypha sp. PMI_526]